MDHAPPEVRARDGTLEQQDDGRTAAAGGHAGLRLQDHLEHGADQRGRGDGTAVESEPAITTSREEEADAEAGDPAVGDAAGKHAELEQIHHRHVHERHLEAGDAERRATPVAQNTSPAAISQ